jgi:hypothetical protein
MYYDMNTGRWYILRASKKDRQGNVIYARDYGKKAFKMLDYENKALGNTIYINRTLSAMRQLNEEGQKIVANQAELVKASGKYDRAKSERIYKEAAYGGDLDSDTADERLAIVDKRRKILEEKDKKQK